MSEIRSKDNRTSVFSCVRLLYHDHRCGTFFCAFAASDTCIHIYFCHNTFPDFNGISGTYFQTAAAGNTVTGTDKGFFLIFFSTVRPPEFDRNSITWSWEGVCEFVTDCNIFQIIYICACCTYLEK